jgi:murein L,D-transpeptidase YcbB/YkuD
MRRRSHLGIGVAVAGASIVVATAVPPFTTARPECTSAEDVRSETDSTDDLRLLLNLPAYRLDVIERERVTRSIPVAVGQPRYRTPLGHFQVDYAVWNPWWIPPKSDWARKERPQRPGWANPVGRVKLHVTGLVFLHGTPLEDSRGSAASHACVRMSNEDAIALARLLHERAGPPLAPAVIDSLVADTSRTRTIALGRTVPIDIEYRLAEARAGELVVYPDVYRLAGPTTAGVEEQAIEALLRAQIDTTGIAMERIRTLARASRRAPARMSLDSLFTSRDTTR